MYVIELFQNWSSDSHEILYAYIFFYLAHCPVDKDQVRPPQSLMEPRASPAVNGHIFFCALWQNNFCSVSQHLFRSLWSPIGSKFVYSKAHLEFQKQLALNSLLEQNVEDIANHDSALHCVQWHLSATTVSVDVVGRPNSQV